MIIAQNTRDISRSGEIKDTGFSVKATGKAFKILSSSLYKNKIRAIIRELSCNAYDAHVMVKTPQRQFDVHIPNALESYFSVRDYGPGLSEEDVYSIYTTYFESTKTQSNDYVGALGLGSKSPFSYTDSYNVTSIHEQMKSVYTLYMNEYDCPVVSKMGITHPTNEPNGLEVRMSVKNTDISSFRAEALYVYKDFTTVPNVTGFPGFKVETKKIIHDGGYYHVLESDRYSNENSVVMGNIRYPVYIDNFAKYIKSTSPLARVIENFRYFSIQINAPVGSVDFTAGREDLSYDEKVTVPFLIKTYESILIDFTQKMKDKIANLPNEFEARKFFYKNYSDPTFKLYAGSGMFWNGMSITHSTLTVKDLPLSFDIRRCNKLTASDVARVIFDKADVTSRIPVSLEVSIDCSNAENNLTFFVNDTKTTGINDLRTYFKENKTTYIYSSYYINSKDKKVLDTFLTNFPGVKTMLISDVVKSNLTANPKNIVARKKTRMKVLSQNAIDCGYITRDLTEVDVDLEDGGIYMLSSNAALYEKQLPKYMRISGTKVLSSIVDLLDKKTVYVVPISISDKIVKHDKWVNLFDAAKEKLDKEMSKYDIAYLEYIDSVPYTRGVYEQVKRLYETFKNQLRSDSSIVKFVEHLEKYEKEKKVSERILPLVQLYDLKKTNTKVKHDITLDKFYKDVMIEYPMLSLINSSFSHVNVISYIKMCDSYNRKGDKA